MMKIMRSALALLLAASLLTSGVAAAGTSSDPLITRAYLNNEILADLRSEILDRTDPTSATTDAAYAVSIQKLGEAALEKVSLDALAELAADKLVESAVQQLFVPGACELRSLKLSEGTSLKCEPGAIVYVVSGRVQTVTSSGATMVNIRTADELSLSWDFAAGSYLLVTEYGGVEFRPVLGDAAVLVSGVASIGSYEPYVAQYKDLADALLKMGLFKGTNTGYELERSARRDEGLVMMLRLLGEEAEALSQNLASPFSDTFKWLAPYAAYAYANGITNGISTTSKIFGSGMLITADQYMTFLLRALGYTDSGSSPEFSYKTAVASAVSYGILTAQEGELMTDGLFTRDKLVYMSYYALFAKTKGSDERLLDKLIRTGAVDRYKAYAAVSAVTRQRG